MFSYILALLFLRRGYFPKPDAAAVKRADLRLTELGRRTGLISEARYARLMGKKADMERALKALSATVPPSEALNELLTARNSTAVSNHVRLMDILRREGITYTDLMSLAPLPDIADEAREQVEISAHYDGYIEKQRKQVEKLREQEARLIPEGLDYMALEGLRIEARQKLSAIRPNNIGQASRISGVSPADIGVLLIHLKQLEGK